MCTGFYPTNSCTFNTGCCTLYYDSLYHARWQSGPATQAPEHGTRLEFITNVCFLPFQVGQLILTVPSVLVEITNPYWWKLCDSRHCYVWLLWGNTYLRRLENFCGWTFLLIVCLVVF